MWYVNVIHPQGLFPVPPVWEHGPAGIVLKISWELTAENLLAKATSFSTTSIKKSKQETCYKIIYVLTESQFVSGRVLQSSVKFLIGSVLIFFHHFLVMTSLLASDIYVWLTNRQYKWEAGSKKCLVCLWASSAKQLRNRDGILSKVIFCWWKTDEQWFCRWRGCNINLCGLWPQWLGA